jgi:hypothetical protein
MANIFRRICSQDSHSGSNNLVLIADSENAFLPTSVEIQLVGSPPILVGFPNDAQGVPISGQLKLRLVTQYSRMVFTQIRLSIVQITNIKPGSGIMEGLYKGHRATGTSKFTIPRNSRGDLEELAHWNAPTSTCVLSLDQNSEQRAIFDFTLRIPGHVPATTNTAIGSVSYALVATAIVDEGRTLQTRVSIPVQRVIPCSNTAWDDIFLHCYPDTRLRSKLKVPAVINPTGPFPVTLLFQRLNVRRKRTSSRLAIRKCKWRIDEITRIVSISSPELESSEYLDYQEMKRHVRRLAGGNCGKRWAQDSDSQIRSDFEIMLPGSVRARCHVPLCSEPLATRQRVISDVADGSQGHPRPTLNLRKTAISVSHILVVEFAIIEEIYDNKTGQRVNLDPWRMSVYGCTHQIFMAHRGVGLRNEGRALDNSELLPPYSDSSNGGPPAYQWT